MSDTKIRLQMIREVAEQADQFYGKAESLGTLAAKKITIRRRNQITDLESVANSALKVADVLNHVKTQTARREYWREVGPALLEVVQTELAGRKDQICKNLALANDHERARQEQHVHLLLIREFVRQMAAQYEYQCLMGESGARS